MCPYAVVSLQKSIGDFGSEKPFSQTYSLERGTGEAVDGGLVYGCIESFQVTSAALGGARFSNEAPRCEASRGEESRRRHEVDHQDAWCATSRMAGPGRPQGELGGRGGAPRERVYEAKGAQSPVERTEEEQRTSCRTKALWAGKSSATSRRRSGSGLGEPRRIGHVHREMHRPVSSEDRDRGVRGSVVAYLGSEEHSPTVRSRSAEAIASVVKRSKSPVSMGQQPLECTSDEESVTMSRKEAGYGCSLTECREAETASTYL